MNIANTMVMHNYDQINIQLTYLQQQKLLTVHGRSFSECDSDHITFSFASQGWQ